MTVCAHLIVKIYVLISQVTGEEDAIGFAGKTSISHDIYDFRLLNTLGRGAELSRRVDLVSRLVFPSSFGSFLGMAHRNDKILLFSILLFCLCERSRGIRPRLTYFLMITSSQLKMCNSVYKFIYLTKNKFFKWVNQQRKKYDSDKHRNSNLQLNTDMLKHGKLLSKGIRSLFKSSPNTLIANFLGHASTEWNIQLSAIKNTLLYLLNQKVPRHIYKI